MKAVLKVDLKAQTMAGRMVVLSAATKAAMAEKKVAMRAPTMAGRTAGKKGGKMVVR